MTLTCNALEKLESFDEDIRFMGLNDLTESFTNCSNVPIDPRLLEAIVKCVGDSSLDVQNQAVKLISTLACSSNSETSNILVTRILEQKASDAVRGVALKHVFQAGKIRKESLGNMVSTLLMNNSVFETVEGVDAMIELVQSCDISPTVSAKLTSHLISMITAKPARMSVLRSVLDAMVLTIPKLTEKQWNTEVRPFIGNKSLDPSYLGLIGKLGGEVPGNWLVPDISEAMVRQIMKRPLEDQDLGYVEANLKAIAAVMSSTPEFRNHHLEDVVKIVASTIAYRNYSDESEDENEKANIPATDNELDTLDEFNDAESDWYDESSCVRQASSQLASTCRDCRCFQLVINALQGENDEATRATMYKTAASLFPLEYGSASRPKLGEILQPCILKDLHKRRLMAADAGIRSIAAHDSFVPPELIKKFMKISRASIHRYIKFLNPSDHSEFNDPNTLNSTGEILHSLFMVQDVSEIPEETLLQAVKLIRAFKMTSLFRSLVNVNERVKTKFTAVKTAILEAYPSLATNYEDMNLIIKEELDAIDNNLSKEEVITGLSALESLFQKMDNKDIIINNSNRIFECTNKVSKYANEEVSSEKDALESKDVVILCCNLLIHMQGIDKKKAARNLVLFDNPLLVPYAQESLLRAGSLLSEDSILKWAIKNKALDVLIRSTELLANLEATLSECLMLSDSPEVYATVVSCFTDGWKQLTDVYKFRETEFKNLGNKELRLLLDLSQRSCRWDWYSLETMESAISNEMQSEVFGTTAAVISGDAHKDACRFARLQDPSKTIAFRAYVKQLRDPSTILEIMRHFPELREASAAAVAIPNHLMLEMFATRFSDSPVFMIETIKLLDLPDLLIYTGPILANFVRSEELEFDIRSDALATLRWIFQITNPVNPGDLKEILELASTALIPKNGLIQTVNIGPFKHKVDPSAVLRQTAVETVYTALMPNLDRIHPELLYSLISHLVIYSLKDNEHDVKVMAYRTVTQIAKAKPEAIKKYTLEIESAMSEDLQRKLKDTAVKQDVEKHADLTHVIAELQLQL